jgi:hypothetical protein
MELQRWSWAIDSKISDGLRIPAGALLDISPPEDDDPQDEMQCARRRYGRRLMATPGVVGTGEEMPPCGLVIQVSKKDPSPVIAVAVKKMRETWETPCGIPFELATELWRHERELSCGLYYRWTNQPPGEWLQTRQAWSRFMRGVLSDSRSLFTPQAIVDAIDSGSLKDGGLLAAWRAAKPTFKPVTEPVWLCDETLKWAADWLESQRGICWVVHTAFGDRLSELTGVPYFAREGKSAQGITIDQWDGPAIAGPGCSNGFNLQGTPFTKARHWRNLVVTSPTKNGPAEQMLSRTHRDGQEEDDVEVTFLQTLEGDERALTQAVSDAKYVEESTRQPQRLTVATWI